MQSFPSVALLLAGFTLAHAIWSISDAPPAELLAPLSIRETAGHRELQRFEAETQVEAIQTGKTQSAAWTRDSTPWAFAREGSMREAGKEVDVMTVDCWAPGMGQPISIVQRFQRYTVDGRFHLLGKMQIVVNGKILSDSVASATVRVIEQGIAQHSRVAPLWATWK